MSNIQLQDSEHIIEASDVNLSASKFDDCNLADCNFHLTTMDNTQFSDVNMVGVQFKRSNFDDAKFDGVSFVNVSVVNGTYDGMTLEGIQVNDLMKCYQEHQG